MNENVYISEAHLKGYKSIVDTKVQFKPGLNIIIGRNGSGKSNIVTFLSKLLSFNFSEFVGISSVFKLIKGGLKKEITVKSIQTNKDEIFTNSQTIAINSVDTSMPFIELLHENFDFVSSLIKFKIPIKIGVISDSIDVREKIDNNNHSQELIKLIISENENNFLKALLVPFQVLPVESKYSQIYEDKRAIIEEFIKLLEVKVCKYTVVEKIRLNPNFEISIKDGFFEIKNLQFEYLLNDIWYKFDNLSDGTQRIIFIISEIINFRNYGWGKGVVYFTREKPVSKIIFIEEPELGIHPHQLHLLMNFLKEEADDKQIIITTHSPQVLNILSKDELDRVLICEWTKDKGTRLRNMTEQESHDANVYMNEVGFMSDYWLHSDFNRI
ncbi:MAG: ATP-binding protein [Flavobacteriales bacterium]|nr:ATP-binding protein [Flavobacteriales bacterium]